MSLAIKNVTESYIGFAKTSYRFMHIQTDEDYEDAIKIVEHLMLSLDKSGNDPLMDLLDIISKAIEKYESKLQGVQDFTAKYRAFPKDVSMLKYLMVQHELGVIDFKDEIGSKSYVSMIINGERQLNKRHIKKLCMRFNLSPELFF